jgi:4-hydroxybenzoate polyprenyltransferase
LLWFYSTTYKRQVLIGNLVVAFMVAAVPLLILLYELPLLLTKYHYFLHSEPTAFKLLIAWIVGYGAFAFILTLMREIVKDIEDYEGDFAFGRQTIPIAWGAGVAKIIVLVLSVIVLLLFVIIAVFVLGNMLSIVYSISLLVIPMIIFMFLFYKSNTKEDYHKSSKLLKIVMLFGLAYVLLAYFFVY